MWWFEYEKLYRRHNIPYSAIVVDQAPDETYKELG
jgi:hypothetical protein